jgi:uncharacterized protein
LSERLKAFGWTLFFLGGGFAAAVVLASLLRPFFPGGALSLVALQTLVLLGVFVFLTWLVGRRVLKLSPAEFGVMPLRPGLRGFGVGFVLGAVLAAAAMAAAVALGRAEWRGDGGTVLGWVGAVAATGLLLLPAALVEELMFRGVPLAVLSRGFGRGAALVGLAVLFAAAHFRNEGVSPLALANIALAGVFLGLAFFTAGGLWTATGAHLGWNLGLAALAAPVSGLLLPIPWLDYIAGSPAWLTGGLFGPEGGILGSIFLGAGALYIGRRTKPERVS